jgi:hypothetical protein
MAMTVWPQLSGKPATVWLWNRTSDVLFAAGGGSLLFALTMVPLTLSAPSLAPYLAAAFLHMAALCNFPHYAATYQLVFREREKNPHTWRRLWASTPVMMGLLGAGIAWPPLISPLTRIYLTWSAYHYAAQHFGIASMYATRHGRPLEDADKRTLQFGFIAVAGFMMVMTNTAGVGSANPFGARVGSQLEFLLPSQAYYLALASAALGAVAFVIGDRRMARRTGQGYGALTRLLFATNAAWFVLPFVRLPGANGPWMGGTLAIWVPYAIPFFHCAQYLAVTTWRARTTGPVKPTLLFIGLAALGLLLFEGVTRAVFSARLLSEDNAYLLVPAILNIHHFWVDGIMWRRVGKKNREPLISLTPT